ncbi:MAG: DNA cytosine methyltransferase [Rhodospirillaceae bacterium]
MNFVSLFSGCGGFDLGFTRAGFDCLAAFDKDAAAFKVHSANIRSSFSAKVDLATGFPDEWVIPNSVDLVIGGPPCQGFSLAGKMDPSDPRNDLFNVAAELALKIKPKFILIENVAAASKTPNWRSAQQRFQESGYKAETILWSASQFGVPQIRKRAFLLGIRQHSRFEIRLPARRRLKTVGEVLRKVKFNKDRAPVPLCSLTKVGAIADHIMPGMKLCNVRNSDKAVRSWDIPDVFGPVTASEREVLEAIVVLRRRNRVRSVGDADPVAARNISQYLGRPVYQNLSRLIRGGHVRKIEDRYDIVRTFNGKYRRLSWDELSPAVTTQFGDPTHFLHPSENRALTAKEAAYIQSFPKNFVFDVSERQALRLIGNAVPPAAARNVAGQFRKALV